MIQSIHAREFAQYRFDQDSLATPAGTIIEAILQAGSLRLTDLSQ